MKSQMPLINFMMMFPDWNDDKEVHEVVQLHQELETMKQEIQDKIDNIYKRHLEDKYCGYECSREDFELFCEYMGVYETNDVDYIISKKSYK